MLKVLHSREIYVVQVFCPKKITEEKRLQKAEYFMTFMSTMTVCKLLTMINSII